jgi:multiple sugar transport system substrate-binding protein
MSGKKPSRRDFLKISAGASATILASGLGVQGVLGQDATPTPLPLPEGAVGKLTIIHKTEYFDAVQTLFRDDVVAYAQNGGYELDISTANPELFGDFTTKMLAAVEAGNPPDLAYHVLSIPQLYALDIVEDVSDIVEELISLYGAPVPAIAEFNGKLDDKWWGVPFMSIAAAWFARRDLFEAKGIDVCSLESWDDYRDAALEVSDPDNNVWGWGLTVNQSGDAHGLILGVIQGFGGSFTDETGLVVTFNSPETVAAVEWLTEIYTSDKYKPMLPPGVESWNDISNNEAYLAGTIALTTNQPSVYGQARRDGNPVFEQTAVLHAPRALDGRRLEAGQSGWFTIFKNAKNPEIARDLIMHMLDPQQYTPLVQNGGGLFLPAYRDLWTDDVMGSDPNFAVFRDILFNEEIFYGRSHPAKPSALHDAIDGAAINSQMMANAISGRMTPAEAVADAHEKIVILFEESGVMQG